MKKQLDCVGTSGCKVSIGTIDATPNRKTDWDRIAGARRDVGLEYDDCPADSFSCQEYSDKFGLSGYTAAERELRKLFASGVLKCGKKRMKGSDGKGRLMRVYWIP